MTIDCPSPFLGVWDHHVTIFISFILFIEYLLPQGERYTAEGQRFLLILTLTGFPAC